MGANNCLIHFYKRYKGGFFLTLIILRSIGDKSTPTTTNTNHDH